MPARTAFSTRGLQGSRFDVQSWTFQPDLNWADGQDEDDEDSTDALEGSLVEVTESEFPSYFSERDGRLFHSHGASPYPLPVDAPEQRRLNVQHNIIKILLGANYRGPVPQALTNIPDRRRLVVDLGSGTGKWVMEIARQFPHANVVGLDIVPIGTMYPLDNVCFEVQDMNERFRWVDGSVDVIHARSISMAIHDFKALLTEVARVLRPGGLFLSSEWIRAACVHPNLGVTPESHIPNLVRFFEMLRAALASNCGTRNLAPHVPDYLSATTHFVNIDPCRVYVPIGPWVDDPIMRTIGRAYRKAFRTYVESVKPILLRVYGEELQEVYDGVNEELRTRRGLVGIMHVVCAERA
ncbi:hypothetical protein CCMSSC00406_0005175 [Pleurotus cornucopiae]|uniref:Uncharacterized protein n=1 Tax=Pleurotus cornucopiae TaxID=5321 RepID=A0ACB7II45_PLECO|nr:hypothetical protein CCMSSC00406_0005175 [Pleurotus cornucopiae]